VATFETDGIYHSIVIPLVVSGLLYEQIVMLGKHRREQDSAMLGRNYSFIRSADAASVIF